MPHANIWVRKENEEKWLSVKDKSAWVNSILEEVDKPGLEEPVKNVSKPKSYANKRPETSRVEIRTCKSGHQTLREDRKCMTKGCKYNIY